jgi:hypothetical protein
MKREDIIRMAREAGCIPVRHPEYDNDVQVFAAPDVLERFAALVAAAKDAEHQEAMRWDVHSCGPTCKRHACVAVREAVEAEREACAKTADTFHGPSTHPAWHTAASHIAAAIRARSQA